MSDFHGAEMIGFVPAPVTLTEGLFWGGVALATFVFAYILLSLAGDRDEESGITLLRGFVKILIGATLVGITVCLIIIIIRNIILFLYLFWIGGGIFLLYHLYKKYSPTLRKNGKTLCK